MCNFVVRSRKCSRNGADNLAAACGKTAFVGCVEAPCKDSCGLKILAAGPGIWLRGRIVSQRAHDFDPQPRKTASQGQQAPVC